MAAWPWVESRGNVISSSLSADALAWGRMPCWGTDGIPNCERRKRCHFSKSKQFFFLYAWHLLQSMSRNALLFEGRDCLHSLQIREVFLGMWSHISVQGWRWAGRSCTNTQQVFGSEGFSAVSANLPTLPSTPPAWLCPPQSQECTALPAWSCWALACSEKPSKDRGIQTKQPVFYSRADYPEIFTIEGLMEPACSCQNVWLTCWFSNSPLLLRYLKAFPNIFFHLQGHNLLVAFLVC